jgi:hypothetical protein
MSTDINEHNRAAKRLFAPAEQCRTRRRRRLLRLARRNLLLAKARLENPALWPHKRRSENTWLNVGD